MDDIPDGAKDSIGRTITAADIVTAGPVAAMMATLGRDGPAPEDGDPLPPLWHGMFCTAKLPPDRLGPDGLAKDEPLLPALADYPRKLFGGARFTFERPLRIGESIRKVSAIERFDAKTGRSGAFLVATVAHRIIGPDGLATLEENDVIFRPPAKKDAEPTSDGTSTKPEPFGGDAWRRTVEPDAVLMFRHSALTFNSHRIHYDRDYAKANGYPGLLVQGTLIARLMLELVHDHRPEADLSGFAFRSGRPLYDTGPFTLEGEPDAAGTEVRLCAIAPDGAVSMTATARL